MQTDTSTHTPLTRGEKLLAWFERIGRFYVEGFRRMTVGKTLWIIIIVKLIIMFAILKPIFFKAELSGLEPEEKQERVGNNLIERKAN